MLLAADQMRIRLGYIDPAFASINSGMALCLSASNGDISRKNSVSFVVIASITWFFKCESFENRTLRARSA